MTARVGFIVALPLVVLSGVADRLLTWQPEPSSFPAGPTGERPRTAAPAAAVSPTPTPPLDDQIHLLHEVIDARTCRLEGRFEVAAPPATAWGVLTDYDRLADFVSSLEVSRIRTGEDGERLLEQTARGRVFVFSRSARVLLRLAERPPEEISFEDTLGQDFDHYSGAWGIAPIEGGSRITYQLDARRNFAAPGFLARGVMTRNVTALLTEVRDEILRHAPPPVPAADAPGPETVAHRIVAADGSLIRLEGTSTLHDYECATSQVEVEGTVEGAPGDGIEPTLRQGHVRGFVVRVPVATLRSGKSRLDRNLCEALREPEHPAIVFRLDAIAVGEDGDPGAEILLSASGTLEVAGVARDIALEATARVREDSLRITGTEEIDMTDYGVVPPTMMLGALRTAPKVTIRYEIELRLDPP